MDFVICDGICNPDGLNNWILIQLLNLSFTLPLRSSIPQLISDEAISLPF
jgi:hypothetical protein